ncbi:MAG: hypothetical protein H0U22_06875 [Geodermatophilaceae bacterium]|nr:hypothetical protein [Geodermatophilaceae bacterium]
MLVIGAGQAGLGTTYVLTRTPALRVLALDSAEIGQSWLDRWDSLTLFTPRRFSGLPGWGFPRGSGGHPSRTEMVAYVRDYSGRSFEQRDDHRSSARSWGDLYAGSAEHWRTDLLSIRHADQTPVRPILERDVQPNRSSPPALSSRQQTKIQADRKPSLIGHATRSSLRAGAIHASNACIPRHRSESTRRARRLAAI